MATTIPGPIIPLARILATLDRLVATQRNLPVPGFPGLNRNEEEHDDLREAARLLRRAYPVEARIDRKPTSSGPGLEGG